MAFLLLVREVGPREFRPKDASNVRMHRLVAVLSFPLFVLSICAFGRCISLACRLGVHAFTVHRADPSFPALSPQPPRHRGPLPLNIWYQFKLEIKVILAKDCYSALPFLPIVKGYHDHSN